jgi:hypothetical protein
VYTSFPWPALCGEVEKLRIELPQRKELDGDLGTLATGLATRARNTRNRWLKEATPAGFENFRGSASPDETPHLPREKPDSDRVSWGLMGSRGSKVARLAALAANAVRACDLVRALTVLDEIQAACEPSVGGRTCLTARQRSDPAPNRWTVSLRCLS